MKKEIQETLKAVETIERCLDDGMICLYKDGEDVYPFNDIDIGIVVKISRNDGGEESLEIDEAKDLLDDILVFERESAKHLDLED